VAAAAVRARVRAQRLLVEDPSRATAVGKKLFPEAEAGLIAELIRRDAPFYDPAISRRSVEALNAFARNMGILSGPVAYEQVVATQFSRFWQ
jgi:ABC-type nitrate/sulfonate/bicarbonate transport system substrate-binding protein